MMSGASIILEHNIVLNTDPLLRINSCDSLGPGQGRIHGGGVNKYQILLKDKKLIIL